MSRILVFVLIAGLLVLVSYALGIWRASKPADLWGGVTPGMQMATVPVMFVAAAGFIAFCWILLIKGDVASLHWPWGSDDGRGESRAFLAFALFLIPSMLWLESTLIHLRSPAPWTPFLVIGILLLVAIGNILLILLAVGAVQDGTPYAGWALAGIIALALQCIVNDLFIWSIRFPW